MVTELSTRSQLSEAILTQWHQDIITLSKAR